MPVEEDGWDEDEVVIPPADFANVSATPSPGHPSSDAPGHDEDPHPAAAAIESEDDERKDTPAEFDPRVREDFEGLLYLGRLTKTFHWMGHDFTIKTLTTGEIVEVGLLHKQYLGSLADAKAYQAAVSAACVVSVDGKPMPLPITNEAADTLLLNRFQYVLRSWFPPVLDAIYEQYLLLEARVDEVMEAMGKAHGWTDSTPTSNATSV